MMGTDGHKWYKKNWRDKFDKGEAPNFNMAVLFLERLDDLLKNCSEARYNRNQLLYYTALNELWSNITFRVIEDGEEETELEINNLFIKVRSFFVGATVNNFDVQKNSITKAEDLLVEISKKINVLLYRYGLLMPIPQRKDPRRAIDDF